MSELTAFPPDLNIWVTPFNAWNNLNIGSLMRVAQYLDVPPDVWPRFAIIRACKRARSETVLTLLNQLVACLDDPALRVPAVRSDMPESTKHARGSVLHYRNGAPGHELCRLLLPIRAKDWEAEPLAEEFRKLVPHPTEDEIVAAATRRRLIG